MYFWSNFSNALFRNYLTTYFFLCLVMRINFLSITVIYLTISFYTDFYIVLSSLFCTFLYINPSQSVEIAFSICATLPDSQARFNYRYKLCGFSITSLGSNRFHYYIITQKLCSPNDCDKISRNNRVKNRSAVSKRETKSIKKTWNWKLSETLPQCNRNRDFVSATLLLLWKLRILNTTGGFFYFASG